MASQFTSWFAEKLTNRAFAVLTGRMSCHMFRWPEAAATWSQSQVPRDLAVPLDREAHGHRPGSVWSARSALR